MTKDAMIHQRISTIPCRICIIKNDLNMHGDTETMTRIIMPRKSTASKKRNAEKYIQTYGHNRNFTGG